MRLFSRFPVAVRAAAVFACAGATFASAQTMPFLYDSDISIPRVGKIKEIREAEYRFVDGTKPQNPQQVLSFSFSEAGTLGMTKTDGEMLNEMIIYAGNMDSLLKIAKALSKDVAAKYTLSLKIVARDAAGRLLSEQDAYLSGQLGLATLYAYDALGRVTSIAYTDPRDKTPYLTQVFRYDDKLRRVERFDNEGNGLAAWAAFVRSYDPKGKPVSDAGYLDATGRVGRTITYTYNAKGQIVQAVFAIPLEKVRNSIVYSYDQQGNLVEAFKTATYGLGTANESVEKTQTVLSYTFY